MPNLNNQRMTSNDPSYFQHRKVSGDAYADYELPSYLETRLPESKDARILDFGCGFGHFIRALGRRGYVRAEGYDIEPAALAFCRSNGVPAIDGNQIDVAELPHQYDFIFTSHVLEHIPKEHVIETLGKLRQRLKPGGALFVCVPNAQSSTGCYWAYEDFTHYTAYTSGSLYYVLSKAGYAGIDFVDKDCTEGIPPARRAIKRFLLGLYAANYRFWNRVTSSATHASSPEIFSYEIKAIAKA